MAEFFYNNANNASSGYILFKLNFDYYFCILYKKNVDFYLKFKLINKLLIELRELIIIYKKNFYYIKNFINKFIIKTSSLEAIFLATKFD